MAPTAFKVAISPTNASIGITCTHRRGGTNTQDGSAATNTVSSATSCGVSYTTRALAGDYVWALKVSFLGSTSLSVASPFTLRSSSSSNYRLGTGDDGITSGVGANSGVTATFT